MVSSRSGASMKILLINANKDHKHNFKSHLLYKINSTPILVLQQIAAITPEKHSVKLIDDYHDPPNYDADVDIVGISTVTPSASRAYEIADEFRKRGKTVVLGGHHPSAVPKEAKPHADSIVIGEAENTWPHLLKDFEKGKLKPYYKSESPVDPSIIPEPRRDLLRVKSLFSPVVTSRGCPYYCSFCAIAHLYGRKYRPRPVEDIIREIEKIPRRFIVFVHDSSLTIDREYAKAFLKAMIPLKKKFITWGSAPILQNDDELLKLSRKAGCMVWGIGFESISQKSLRKDAEKKYAVESYQTLVKKIHKYGMNVHGAFVFGFDNDTVDIFDKTLEAVYELDIDSMEFSILTPFPITRLFHKLEKEKRILTYDWNKYDLHHVVFQPANMTPEELFNGVEKISKKFYSPQKTLLRITSNIFKRKQLLTVFATWSINFQMSRFHVEYSYF